MSAYLNQLAKEAKKTITPTPPANKVQRWFTDQPEISRHRAYGIQEIETATGIPARCLGELLIQLGWTRHRHWSSKTSYRRYWLPPSQTGSK